MELYALSGRLSAANDREAAIIETYLPGHIAASRAEPGCLRFDVTPLGDAGRIWQVDELFTDHAAFAAHQARGAASDWGRESAGIARDFTHAATTPEIAETAADASDADEISALHERAFEGPDEGRLIELLRDDGDLALSLGQRAAGVWLAHLALSPIRADHPAPVLALAPVAVHPALQGRGLGSALIRAALAQRRDAVIVVLGSPAYYGRFGFRPVPGWVSPYAGPYLQALGPDLPERLEIAHAPAFAALEGG